MQHGDGHINYAMAILFHLLSLSSGVLVPVLSIQAGVQMIKKIG